MLGAQLPMSLFVHPGDGTTLQPLEALWEALGTTPIPAPQDEPVPDDEPASIAASLPGEPTAADEWDDLRQLLSGDSRPEAEAAPVAFVEAEEREEREDDEPAEADDAEDGVASLEERVAELEAELDEERTRREELADKLDRLAVDLDAVLGEALAEERARREELEETLRRVQSALADPPVDRPAVEDRRQGDRRSSTERRRGLAPRAGQRRERPLRARAAEEEPAPPVEEEALLDQAWDDEELETEALVEDGGLFDSSNPSEWRSRLHEVAGAVAPWTPEDVDRLRSTD
jgi:hypothetical protein